MTVEQRTVCEKCGQTLGLFHKGCDGRWVIQTRTVTQWQTVGLDLDTLSDEPNEALRALVRRHQKGERRP